MKHKIFIFGFTMIQTIKINIEKIERIKYIESFAMGEGGRLIENRAGKNWKTLLKFYNTNKIFLKRWEKQFNEFIILPLNELPPLDVLIEHFLLPN